MAWEDSSSEVLNCALIGRIAVRNRSATFVHVRTSSPTLCSDVGPFVQPDVRLLTPLSLIRCSLLLIVNIHLRTEVQLPAHTSSIRPEVFKMPHTNSLNYYLVYYPIAITMDLTKCIMSSMRRPRKQKKPEIQYKIVYQEWVNVDPQTGISS